MTYMFRTSQGHRGVATKGKNKSWTIKVNGHPWQWLSGGTVHEMKNSVLESFPKATFQKVSR